jgi:hypothetical protein
MTAPTDFDALFRNWRCDTPRWGPPHGTSFHETLKPVGGEASVTNDIGA